MSLAQDLNLDYKEPIHKDLHGNRDGNGFWKGTGLDWSEEGPGTVLLHGSGFDMTSVVLQRESVHSQPEYPTELTNKTST